MPFQVHRMLGKDLVASFHHVCDLVRMDGILGAILSLALSFGQVKSCLLSQHVMGRHQLIIHGAIFYDHGMAIADAGIELDGVGAEGLVDGLHQDSRFFIADVAGTVVQDGQVLVVPFSG